MSKYHKIRWQESDLKELNKVVRNYNAKIKRLEKKNPQIERILPQYYNEKTDTFSSRLTVGQLKELINTRQDLKREINALKRFSKRGSERLVTVPNTDNNLKITKWQLTEMNRRVGIINRRRKKRLEDVVNVEVESRGEKLGYTRGDIGMGRAEEVSLSPMQTFTRRMEQHELKHRWRSIMNQSQSDYFTQGDYRLRDNFINTLKENYNVNDIQDVIDNITNMDINEFLNEYRKDPEAFEWAYPPSEEEYIGYVNALKSTWIK